MTSVDEILDYKKKGDEDFYAILGCDENSSVSDETGRCGFGFALLWFGLGMPAFGLVVCSLFTNANVMLFEIFLSLPIHVLLY